MGSVEEIKKYISSPLPCRTTKKLNQLSYRKHLLFLPAPNSLFSGEVYYITHLGSSYLCTLKIGIWKDEGLDSTFFSYSIFSDS